VRLAIDVAKLHPGDPRALTALDGATKTLRRVSSLVDGLLVFAKSGARPAEGAQADVRHVLSDVVEATGRVAGERGIALELEEICPTTVACSPAVLTSMVSNLLDNAVKYMGERSLKRVSLRARNEGAMTRIEVRDTGPGVPRALWSTIFEPYVRAPGSTVPGLGLGLAAVRRLAEAHGGSVGIADNVPAGSVFWFELPNASGRQPEGAPTVERTGAWGRLAWRFHLWRPHHG
jgi:signal transduction histidine kinase